MCSNNNGVKNSVELADIFNAYGDSYCENNKLPLVSHKAINAICNCRTKALGGHVHRCELCSAEIIMYDSCRNRHCPKCQTMAKARWLEARQAELLPVQYFHAVFTVPHELNTIASYNQTTIYNILFKAAWTTVKTLGADPKRLGGLMGMLAALHTWGQNLLQHIHLHCIIPGGALKKQEWTPSKPKYLFPVKVMSKLFRGIFVQSLRQAFDNGELVFKGSIANLAAEKEFADLLRQLMGKNWVVYSKKPFNGAKGAVDYLARYVYKTAISNDRILSCENNKVSFKWRDYADNNKIKIMWLDAHEFIRRFLIHVLPGGFMRIRSFGFLANSAKTNKIPQILAVLNQPKPIIATKKETFAELMLRLTGIDINICPECKKGRLVLIKTIPNFKQVQFWDTS